MKKFKIGDCVKGYKCHIGIIVGISEKGSYLVDIFNSSGHNGRSSKLIEGNYLDGDTGWYYAENQLTLVTSDNLEISIDL